MRCPNCDNNIPVHEQLAFCNFCGTELRTVCPRCNADNPGSAEHCRECGLELHPDRGHERAAGIRTGNEVAEQHPPLFSRTTLLLIALCGIAYFLWLPIVINWRDDRRVTTCRTNLKSLAMALSLYAKDNDGFTPPSELWTVALHPYYKHKTRLACPARKATYAYAMNGNLSGLPLELPEGADTVGFFEAPGDLPNLYGTDFEWLESKAHPKGNLMVMLRGGVRQEPTKPDFNLWSVPTQPVATPTPPPKPGKAEKITPSDGSAEPLENPTMPGSSPAHAVSPAPTATPTTTPTAAPTSGGTTVVNPTAPSTSVTNPPPPAH